MLSLVYVTLCDFLGRCFYSLLRGITCPLNHYWYLLRLEVRTYF